MWVQICATDRKTTVQGTDEQEDRETEELVNKGTCLTNYWGSIFRQENIRGNIRIRKEQERVRVIARRSTDPEV